MVAGRTQFAFNRPITANAFEIFRINADGTGETQLTYAGLDSSRYPAWSPDGTKIAFDCAGSSTFG